VLAVSLVASARLTAQTDTAQRFDQGRFTAVAYPRDAQLARALLAAAARQDTFPGLPRPSGRVLIAVAPDRARFRAWVGPAAPEWGAAVAFPSSMRIVMQGQRASSDAGDPEQVLRHELAHLALHEFLGDRPPRWFDEGYASYAAAEWGRDEVLATNGALVLRGVPSLEALDSGFVGGSLSADASYALSYRAVAELASLDPDRGLALFFRYWRETGSADLAMRSAYGVTLPAFEQLWQQRTRRRYGALAVAADLSLASLLLLVPFVPLYVARRRRDRRRLAAMLAADAEAERRAVESAIEELLRSIPPAPPPPPPPSAPPSPPSGGRDGVA
jgi:hypothetical protein